MRLDDIQESDSIEDRRSEDGFGGGGGGGGFGMPSGGGSGFGTIALLTVVGWALASTRRSSSAARKSSRAGATVGRLSAAPAPRSQRTGAVGRAG